MSIVIRDEIVASKVDGVGSSDLEEDTLILVDGDVEWLLVCLISCVS